MAATDGWRVVDIICTYGPDDRPFEERFGAISISLVLAGNFIYRTGRAVGLMSPGAVLLGQAECVYQCSHQHGEGDRCLSFQFEPELFHRIAYEAGAKRAKFDCDRLPPLRELAPVSARAGRLAKRESEGNADCASDVLEELAFEIAEAVIPLACKNLEPARRDDSLNPAPIARVLRQMEARSEQALSISELAHEAGMSRYYFLRSFKRATGITPHQWLLRTRLRHAAERLHADREPITDIALDVGFDDLSNFIRSFRAEFGVSPRRFRAAEK